MFFFRQPQRVLFVASPVVIGGAATYYIASSLRKRSFDPPLSPLQFTPTVLTSTEPCGPNSKLLTLTLPPNWHPPSKPSPIWSVYVKDDDIQVERQYTPLEGADEHGRIKLWIKKYDKGEVGRWLHTKQTGDKIEVRGPIKTWEWREDKWDEIIMISGGTGITPFYQLFHSVISRPQSNSNTRFTLLHSSRIPSELPPPEILHPLASYAEIHPDRFRVQLFVDSLPQLSSSGSEYALEVGRIGERTIRQTLELDRPWWRMLLPGTNSPSQNTKRRVLFLVCGPDPMISVISGPFGRNLSQGAVSGILGSMGYTSEQVWKL